MALVQHLLDGIEQRCARRAKSVLQCPVPSRYVPYFKPGKVLRERVDGAGPDPHGEPGGA